MLRVEDEDRARTTYAEHFTVVAVYRGAFDGWYRGKIRTLVPGCLKLKEPGEVHRDVRVHAPFTLQGAAFAPELVAAAADALGVRGPVHFKAPGFAPGTRAASLAFAMHEALVRDEASDLEVASLVTETLAEVLGSDTARQTGAPRAVRRARAFLHGALAEKVTLDQLAAHAALDKFRLVRAFRQEVGLPPYEYLTYLRVARARELLQREARVAQVAQDVGFYDESQLHRHFRRIVGTTPGAYARSLGKASAKSKERARIRAEGRGQDRPRPTDGGGPSSPHERIHAP